MDNNEIIIFYNKYNLFLTALGGLVFIIIIALVCWWARDDKLGEVTFYTYITGKTLLMVGPIAIIFFSIAVSSIIIKIFDPRPALIINESGIFDNSHLFGFGPIRWEETTGFFITDIAGTKSIGIISKNPEEIISRYNIIVRFFMKLNNKWFGSPVHINTSGLDYDFNKLYKTLEEHLEKSKNNKP